MEQKFRPPIVVILGHVDHGKTTLLDYLRQTQTAAREAGGITQRISAYEFEFELPNVQGHKKKITFIDTPGHQIFASLRERGARVADLALLIVAGDSGVQPQTLESLEFLRAAAVPFIVVVTKIDKPNADPARIFQQLSDHGLLVEGWGGQVPAVAVSAKTGEHIDDLLELIVIMSELNELAYQLGPAQGFILETYKDPRKGTLAAAIVQMGELKLGDTIVTATASGKVMFLEDSFGQRVTQVLPSAPVLIGGLKQLPLVGEIFKVAAEAEVKTVQSLLQREESLVRQRSINTKTEAVADYNFIIRADTIGSLEAIEKILQRLAEDKQVVTKIIKADLGQLTLDDLNLARTTNSILIVFNSKTPRDVVEQLRIWKLQLFEGNVVYELEERLKEWLEQGRESSEVLGQLKVLAVFKQAGEKQTVGGEVVQGKLTVGQRLKIIRGETEQGEGKIVSLEQNKQPVREVSAGLCGLIVRSVTAIATGDLLIGQ